MTSPKPVVSVTKEQQLDAIIAEYLKRTDAGQSVDQDALLNAYPDLKDELQSWFCGEALLAGQKTPPQAGTKMPHPTDMRDTIRPGAIESDTASEFSVREFGRYQLLRLLGEGAMGSVYLAADSTLDRRVALKMPKTEGSNDSEFMLRFVREAKSAAALRHENICSVFDAGDHDGIAYITMEYIDGAPLSRLVASSRLSSLDSILTMIHTIADAVGHAHAQGVVHRDLKPGNIIVDNDLKPFVTDFGLARRIDSRDESRITQEGLLIGTPAYMAPEQIKGKQDEVGPGSDIYSLGVIFFELLTARLPFEGRVFELLAKALHSEPPVPSGIRKDLPEGVDDVCLKMLKKDSKDRYPSMAAVKTAVKRLQQDLKLKDDAKVAQQNDDASPLEKYKAHIEQMLKNGQYAEATQSLRQMAQDTREESRALAKWARKKLPAVKKESAALSPSGLQALQDTAAALFSKHDYRGCVQLIEDVPPLTRTDEMEDLLRRAEQTEIEAERLLAEIKTLERKEIAAGLESNLRKFLKLKPGNQYAKRLWKALQTYKRIPSAQRAYRFESGRLQEMPEVSFFRQWVLKAAAVGILVFGCVYSYTILYLQNGQQTLAVHVDDEWLESQGGSLTLSVDGSEFLVSSNPEGSEPISVKIALGPHSFSVSQGDTIVHAPKTLEITKDGRRVLYISPADIELLREPKTNQLAVKQSTMDGDTETSGAELVIAVDENPTLSGAPELAKIPFLPAEAQWYQSTWAQHVGEPVDYTNSIGMKLKLIPAGEFLRGSADDEQPRFENEGPQHPVRLTEPYYLGVTEVTQKQWLDVMGNKPWEGVGATGDDQPIAFINRHEAEEFCEKLSAQEKHTYRLPTEAEWEFACRGGTQLPYAFASFPARLREFAWYEGTIYGDFNPPEEPGPQPVALKVPNVFGLYDMQGNIFEWCHDSYSDSYPAGSEIRINPVIRNESEFGVLRGGSWANPEFDCRPATRGKYEITNRGGGYMGFRVMRVISDSAPNSEPVTQSTSGTESTPTPQDEKKLAPLTESGFDEAKNEQLNGRLKIVSQVHGANEAQLRRWAARLPDSHRPYWISVRSAGKEILFDGLARKAPSKVEWKLEIIDGESKEQYHKAVKGFRPAIVNAYEQDGVLKRQLVLWRGDPGWFYWFGSREHIERKIEEGFDNVKTDMGEVRHLIPTHISAMTRNGGIQNELCQAFGPYTEGEFVYDVGMGQIGSRLLRYHNKGYRLHLFTGIRGSAEPRYNAVFVKKAKNDSTNWWSVSVRLTIAQYEEMLETIDGLGGWPRCVSSTIENGRVVYSVLWDQIPQEQLQGITVLADPETPRVKLRHD